MAQLVTSNQFNTSPDIVGSLSGGLQAGQQIRGNQMQNDEAAAEINRQNQFRQLSGIVADPSRPPEQRLAAKQQLAAIDPERQQKAVQQKIANMSNSEKQTFGSVVTAAVQINAIPGLDGKLQAAKNRRQQLIADGITNTTETDLLIDALEKGDEAGAQAILDSGIKAGQMAGLIEGGDGGAGVSEVQSSKILDDGTVQFVRKDGSVEVVPANEVDAATIEKAQRFGAKVQGIRSGSREEAKSAAGVAKESFKRIGNIRKNMTNLDKGIRLLSEGAKSGAIEKFLPSIRAASIKLDNLQGELGLDVIGSVTFGALSESELLFAKDVALPKGLDEPELKKWMEDKKAAQQKVLVNLEEAAKFLGTPGNTIADFIGIKQAEKAASEAASQQQAAQPAQSAQPAGLPEGVTEDDIAETMRANNMTRIQVLQKLGVQ